MRGRGESVQVVMQKGNFRDRYRHHRLLVIWVGWQSRESIMCFELKSTTCTLCSVILFPGNSEATDGFYVLQFQNHFNIGGFYNNVYMKHDSFLLQSC